MNFKRFGKLALSAAILFLGIGCSNSLQTYAKTAYDKSPPFSISFLKKVTVSINGKSVKAYEPVNKYNIFINYELGMHCVGFDISYCCVIPPYNSIQAQAIKTGVDGKLPIFLTPANKIKLHYYIKDNSYSEGNKMRYWNVSKDNNGNGKMGDPGDTAPNYVWKHLFVYKDLKGTIPKNAGIKDRIHIGGPKLRIAVDHGASGKPLFGGSLDYAGRNGGDIVMTDTLVPQVKNLKLTLTASYIWGALGLPLTAFNDSTRKGSLRSVTEKDFQPFQKSVVELRSADGNPIMQNGHIVKYFGTNPIDIPNCYVCHSRDGIAAKIARAAGLKYSDKEYSYWKTYPDESEYMARLAEASINILSLHDLLSGTKFLAHYNSKSAYNRLGSVGMVDCADCHGDNISGNIQTPRPYTSGYKVVKAMPLTKAIHEFHLSKTPMPDAAGRTQSCQACHPYHFQEPAMNDDTNPYRVVDKFGNPRFSNADVRSSGGGCYLRRDAHSNPNVKPPFFLNAIGTFMYRNISLRDEKGRSISRMRGLYCTNCHSQLSQKLYNYDNLSLVQEETGKTIRNKNLGEIIRKVASGSMKKFISIADPKAVRGENDSYKYYKNHKPAILVKNIGRNGKLVLKPWNYKKGKPVPYSAVSGGSDWWLSAAEPHCADCHIAPFVESAGGKYFPIDQPNKFSLYRYSKAHGAITCQSCHESIHGLYPTRYDGPNRTVDLTTHYQALQYSPDKEYAGPVTCAACHTVNANGVPVQLEGTRYYNDYWASVTLLHFMRVGDQKLSIKELVSKYPYRLSKQVVEKGWK